ncbi:glutathione S-transferase family protein [Pseudomonas saliphila]|uniref:glutathione S-transferase family protein n=1 Tax=Pseudomonas saliphila TaxID=2586906 RepID=UPI00123A0C35|nr:glutathione S-transferase N-terminal domain-containing protein [Pseudomonas saliphila]
MKLYNSIGPNPRLIRLFAAEKGAPLSRVEVDIVAGENRQPAYLAINPTGTTPVIELDDGSRIAETTAICEYLEELFSSPALIGANEKARAHTRMWWRRADQIIVQPLTAGFRGAEGFELFKNRVPCYPDAAEDFKRAAQEGWRWFEAHGEHDQFICGSRCTVVDLLLLCFAEFGEQVGQPIPEDCERLGGWLAMMRERYAGIE